MLHHFIDTFAEQDIWSKYGSKVDGLYSNWDIFIYLPINWNPSYKGINSLFTQLKSCRI